MPASLDRIRREMNVKATPKRAGLTLTIEVTAYDNGMITVDGVPINASPEYDQAAGWADGMGVVAVTIAEFQKQVAKHRRGLRQD